jgi:hypothetical protein
MFVTVGMVATEPASEVGERYLRHRGAIVMLFDILESRGCLLPYRRLPNISCNDGVAGAIPFSFVEAGNFMRLQQG